MKKQLLFLTISTTILTACASSQPNDEQNSSSSVSSSVVEESSSSQSSQSSESSSVEESVSSEPIEESSSKEQTWSSMDEAIDFYENTLRADLGEEQARIDLESKFYDRDGWELIENEGDTMVLFKPNIGREGGQAVEFIKRKGYTEITFFKNDTPYPEQPGTTKVFRNEDHILIDKEKKDSNSSGVIDPFTPENAFEYMKETGRYGINDDILVEYSVYHEDENYYQLKLVSKSIQAQGGSGTVGIYHVYEDGIIVDTYAV